MNFNGSLYHATCLTLICISKRPMQILYIVQTETPATLNINRILDINTSQLHVHITGKTLFLLQRIFDANSKEIHMYITYMCLWVTIV